jgi:hypothetical protein
MLGLFVVRYFADQDWFPKLHGWSIRGCFPQMLTDMQSAIFLARR